MIRALLTLRHLECSVLVSTLVIAVLTLSPSRDGVSRSLDRRVDEQQQRTGTRMDKAEVGQGSRGS